MSSTNPLVDGLVHVAKAPAMALATGVPVPSSPIPNTWQTTTPPILGPDGIQVHGFRMDPATVKLGAPIIEESLLGAITMAQITVEKLQRGGPTDPDFLMLFKNATYYDTVLCKSAFKSITCSSHFGAQ